MITNEQITEVVYAVADEGTVSPYNSGMDFITLNPKELHRFALHFWRQGLLDGAKRCNEVWECGGSAHNCDDELREMAKGVE